MKKADFKSFGQLLQKRAPKKKAPAYQWQDLALQIIQDLEIPKDKRSSVFQVCKKFSRQIIERALNDTKELCQTGEKWRYFFKLIHAKPGTPAVEKPAGKNLPF